MKNFLEKRVNELESLKVETTIQAVHKAINNQIARHKEQLNYLNRLEKMRGKSKA